MWGMDSPWPKAAQLLMVTTDDLEGIWKIKRNNTYKDSRDGWLLINCIAYYKGIIRN